MSLIEQIDSNRRKIISDSYPMSLGEIINLYNDGDLDVHPEFQRFYRWDDNQKSNLIESILLGIPLPSFFISTREDGVWDLVDGLQRLATILSFIGIYKDENNKLIEPLILSKTKYLPGLENYQWKSNTPTGKDLPIELQRDFKRYKIDLKIIKKESDPTAKFDLFQRLNTGGTKLEGQEVRNCLLIMVNKNGFDYLTKLANKSSFTSCIPITERQISESFYNELILRFLIIRECINHNIDIDIKNGVDDFLSEMMIKIFSNEDYDYTKAENNFDKIFTHLKDLYNENSFRTYSNNDFKGAFILSRFEAICSYMLTLEGSNISYQGLEKFIENLGTASHFTEATRAGTKALTRTKKLLSYGYDTAKKEE